jgi:hypothetical protein
MTTWKYDRKRDAYTKAGYTIICLREDGYMVRFAGQTILHSIESLRTIQARCDEHAMEREQAAIANAHNAMRPAGKLVRS